MDAHPNPTTSPAYMSWLPVRMRMRVQGDIARQLHDATGGTFNATVAASTAKWDTWFQPLIVTRL